MFARRTSNKRLAARIRWLMIIGGLVKSSKFIASGADGKAPVGGVQNLRQWILYWWSSDLALLRMTLGNDKLRLNFRSNWAQQRSSNCYRLSSRIERIGASDIIRQRAHYLWYRYCDSWITQRKFCHHGFKSEGRVTYLEQLPYEHSRKVIKLFIDLVQVWMFSLRGNGLELVLWYRVCIRNSTCNTAKPHRFNFIKHLNKLILLSQMQP